MKADEDLIHRLLIGQIVPGTDADHNWYTAIAMADPMQEMATSLDDVVYIVGNNGSTPFAPPETVSKTIISRISVRSLVDLSFDDMEVWAYDGQSESWVNQAVVVKM